ncbi:BTAD domain-containing putative transcriptional regulator [Dactylosporangium matsuzakiense]|uniref:BTAD domain-containing putative transcriptional regulator n=1 Tax=Dactylosporangium matsuzakiense TaxID=53360 RepID=UPI0021C44B48|nr:BTAD domain-containing putative transcriptional regulator [Dactylosporangium matsuzakiense]UWZ47192.1 winged helix-turn-helix domain-containing protein [Dactylosporangium matsuzakiense]
MDVRVLGSIEIIDPADVGGRRLTGDDLPRRARQVLGVLAARHDRVQSKDALADAVWGEELPGNHAAALEHYVSVLRRALQPGVPTSRSFIVTRAGGYVFATDRARLDLAELRVAARAAEDEPGRADVREEIVRLARDLPFTEDEYADWALPVRAEVKSVLVGALLDLAERAADGDPARALRFAREAVELEPFTEGAYRVAMRAAAGQGRKEEVLRWYDMCLRSLTDQLGIAPAAATTALRDALLASLEGGPPAFDRRRGDRRKAVRDLQAPAGGPAAGPPHTDRAPLGPAPGQAGPSEPARRANLAVVRDVAESMATVTELNRPVAAAAAAPEEGPAFAGRSAELQVLADGPGVVHVAGPAGAGKSALLQRLRELYPERVGLGRGPGPGGALRLGWLRTVLHQLGVPADDVLDSAMAARRHLLPGELDGIAERLREGGRGRPAVVAIDDAEHLDADSVAELRWLREREVRVVVSYRYPSAIAERPLGALDADLVLRLAPLSAGDLPGPLLEASGGIPALVTAARELSEELALEVAMHLARQRTRWMPPAAWEILRLTAALGSLRVEQVAAAGGLELDDVLGAVDQLVHAHLLVEGPGGHVRHRSGLVRAAVAAQVSAARGQHLRARLA